MKIKTRDLTGPALDWAVAKAADYLSRLGDHWMVTLPGVHVRMNFVPGPRCVFTPSTRWAQGGPIIEREFISVSPGEWDIDAIPVVQSMCAWSLQAEIHGDKPFYYGPTALIAAMRCYVASKLGDEVDIPEELL